MAAKKRLSLYLLLSFLSFTSLPYLSRANTPEEGAVEENSLKEEEAEKAPEEKRDSERELVEEQNPPSSDNDEDEVRVVRSPAPSAREDHAQAPEEAEPAYALKSQVKSPAGDERPSATGAPATPRWEQELGLAHAKTVASEATPAATGCSLRP